MALTPEEAKKKAVDATIASGEEQVAVFIKQQYTNLGLLYQKDFAPASDSDYQAMAKSLIDKRQFTAKTKDGEDVVITLEDLDKKDTEKNLGIKASRGVDNLEKLVPTREQLETTANTIGEGVAENTGTIGFLGGATLMSAIMGLLQWVFSGFAGGFEGLTNSIAQVSANSMQSSVTSKLEQLRESRPDMEHILSDKMIASAGEQVQGQVKKEAGLTTEAEAAATAAPGLKNAKTEGLDDMKLGKIRTEIREQILHPAEGKHLQTVIEEKYTKSVDDYVNASWANRAKKTLGLVPGKAEINKTAEKMAPIIADTISDRITDPNFKTADGKKLGELSKEQFASVIADEVGKELLAKEKTLGMPIKLSDKAGDKERPNATYLDGFKDEIRSQVAKNYDKVAPVIALVKDMEGDPAKKLASTLDKKQFSQDITGGVEHSGGAPQLAGIGKQSGGMSRGGNDLTRTQGPGSQPTLT